MKGYTKVWGLPAMMRNSHFGYSRMYPSYFEWLHHLLLVLGNGYMVDSKRGLYTYTVTERVDMAKGRRIPKEWFSKPPVKTNLYPYSELCLLGQILRGVVPLTPELRNHILKFREYLVQYEMNPYTESGEVNIVEVMDQILSRTSSSGG